MTLKVGLVYASGHGTREGVILSSIGENCSVFLAAIEEDRRTLFASHATLADEVNACLSQARIDRPDVNIPEAQYVRHLAQKLGNSQPTTAFQGLGRDLLLACACGYGNERAIALFEHEFMPEVDTALRSMRLGDDEIGELKQRLRLRFLVQQHDKSPKILDYAGRGSLKSWVRVCATRMALNHIRDGKKVASLEDDLMRSLPSASLSPELAFVKEMSAEHVRSAFQEALHALSAREKNLISHHYVAQLNIDEIGNIYNIHRATAARWLERARVKLLARLRRELMRQLDQQG
ncbi:MAG: sigma-70 family RNA polymerase sigma factor [Myxococcota bacterium]